MAVQNVIPYQPLSKHSGVYGRMPTFWIGEADRDGDAEPWISAPIGSIYIYHNVGSGLTVYLKDANAGADADWGTFDVTT